MVKHSWWLGFNSSTFIILASTLLYLVPLLSCWAVHCSSKSVIMACHTRHLFLRSLFGNKSVTQISSVKHCSTTTPYHQRERSNSKVKDESSLISSKVCLKHVLDLLILGHYPCSRAERKGLSTFKSMTSLFRHGVTYVELKSTIFEKSLALP